jgi:hypothetical protein
MKGSMSKAMARRAAVVRGMVVTVRGGCMKKIHYLPDASADDMPDVLHDGW